ncbi:PREDICTED: uncharacterized protein LOC106101190 isoform X2 [Papilio polytes]|uniref:uncharacterized protein LOC106101190 isoform X2 n=1 Tax=Papilio polytes TaxID=76194 RepID=UPI0006765D98|nr:PREDICTED: uncharacterized protein LOC106101190 isoform X2 [Papilio polytes]
MSYLSTSENVGFSSIPQNISDASCASQYKMAVEGVSGNCGSEVNMFIHDSSGDEQTYIPHLSDNFFHSKFKIDPNDLYTFHDSDVIASEITVSHTEDNFIFPDNIDIKSKFIESPNKDLDLIGVLTNGDVKEEIVETKKETLNGHYPIKNKFQLNVTDGKNANTKVQNSKAQNNINLDARNTIITERKPINTIKVVNNVSTPPHNVKVSINSVNSTNIKSVSTTKLSAPETFLDVFKREHGVVETPATVVKTEPVAISTIKVPAAPIKKPATVKTPTSKAKRGRGPTVHEALQRIPAQNKVIALANTSWHAPGEELFQCGPLDEKKANAFRQVDTSSSDDDIPDLDVSWGPVCVEESAAESRSARLALRRAALKRHVARAAARPPSHYSEQRALATLIKKQLSDQSTSCRLPTQTVNHLLAMRGMHNVLSSEDRRKLRECGWCGRGAGAGAGAGGACGEEQCVRGALPSARHCLAHVTRAPAQRLYAACAAVFAGGERCHQPLLPLHDHTPLCTEHAWKRDNYEQLSREWRPQKARRRACPAAPRPPRRAKRRRRVLARRTQHAHSLTEINICSNSSTYDSSEDAAVGALSETEYMRTSSAHELVEQVPPDDILDPSVLSQIPDEAFTEFFNQAEDVPSFGEGSELAAALEAVLEERGLHERALDISDCFTHAPAPATATATAPGHAPASAPATDTQHKLKMAAASALNVAMSPSAPS